MVLNENVDCKIIAFAGGKGGVGKSVLSSNVALSLALYGKRTILVDLDLGGSNLHTILGMKNNNPGMGHFISGRKYTMNDILCPTHWDNLAFIPGDTLISELGDLTSSLKNRIMNELLQLEADYILLDLGAGSNFNVLDFFLISNSGIIVTTPQTTSIMNAYSFMKNLVVRFLKRAFASDKKITGYLKKAMKEQNPQKRTTIPEILSQIAEKNPKAGKKAQEFLEVLQPKLILNRTTGPNEMGIARGLKDLCMKNLMINLECLGTMKNDPVVDSSVNAQRPFVLDHQDGVSGGAVLRIAQKIIQSRRYPEMPLDFDYYSDSFELAEIEMENDLESEVSEGGASSSPQDQNDVGPLLDLIQVQQDKIKELQKNQFSNTSEEL